MEEKTKEIEKKESSIKSLNTRIEEMKENNKEIQSRIEEWHL